MKIRLIFISCLTLFIIFARKKTGTTATVMATPVISTETFFAKGADVSWLTQMEDSGMKFYNSSGAEQECMSLLKNSVFNSIRIRVWVNPANGWNNTADLIAKAIRAKNLGMRIMIDFHYSDSWADPGQQTKPAAWSQQDFATLRTSVYEHTSSVMNALKINGISPEWVQIGNETNDGMLWPDGKASINMANYAKLFISGYDAVKAISSSSKVIVHISNGFDNALFRWNLDGLKANGAEFDVIGMSLYPTSSDWPSLNTQCLLNMQDVAVRYGKEIMIAEIGMRWTDSASCKAFIEDLIVKTKSIPGNKGLGVFYWEPQAYNNWQGYSLGAFNNSGRPTVALSAFR